MDINIIPFEGFDVFASCHRSHCRVVAAYRFASFPASAMSFSSEIISVEQYHISASRNGQSCGADVAPRQLFISGPSVSACGALEDGK